MDPLQECVFACDALRFEVGAVAAEKESLAACVDLEVPVEGAAGYRDNSPGSFDAPVSKRCRDVGEQGAVVQF